MAAKGPKWATLATLANFETLWLGNYTTFCLHIWYRETKYKRLHFGSEAHLVLGIQRGNMYSVCCMFTWNLPPLAGKNFEVIFGKT